MGRARRRSWGVVVLALMGVVLVGHEGPETDGAPPAAVPPVRHGDACGSSTYATHGTRQYHSFTWVVNTSTIPDYLDRTGAVRAFRRGTATMARARSGCPAARWTTPALPEPIYAGSTRRQANITPWGECFPPSRSDGIYVVSFGRLPDHVVAVTCTYSDRGDIWQSDIMLNDKPGLFTLTPWSRSCVDSYDLQAVMTHERGHTFGLAHVSEASGSSDLTMSSIMGQCDPSSRTLGWGDVVGLSHIY